MHPAVAREEARYVSDEVHGYFGKRGGAR
jgi:hypothetical protein